MVKKSVKLQTVAQIDSCGQIIGEGDTHVGKAKSSLTLTVRNYDQRTI